MTNLQIITIDEPEKWDTIVKSFDQYDVYYLSGYTKAFQMHGDGEPILFYYEDDQIRAINVVMKRDISKIEIFADKIPAGSCFDLTTPYGYGGFLIEGDINECNLKELDHEYSSMCEKQGIVSEFVRFHPLLRNVDILEGIYDTVKLGKTISMDLQSEEQIWLNLTSNNRKKIRKAKRSGVEIFWGRSNELYENFIELYKSTMDKHSAREYYYFGSEFFNIILNDLKFNSLIFYAVYQDRIISTCIVLFANQKMHTYLSALDKEHQSLAPTNLLLYEAACWGCENGYKRFHLGGGVGSSEDSIYEFKSNFNQHSNNTFEIGKKIYNPDKYEELVEIRKQFIYSKYENNFDNVAVEYFPEYRADVILV